MGAFNITSKLLFKYMVKKRKNSAIHQKIEYTNSYTKEMDTEGLSVLRWSLFDSPDVLGSGKNFMESEPVFILDEVLKRARLTAYIIKGYVSKTYGDKIAEPSMSSHRVGKAIEISCTDKVKRFKIVRGLIQYGIERIRVSSESIYFDNDSYLKGKSFDSI